MKKSVIIAIFLLCLSISFFFVSTAVLAKEASEGGRKSLPAVVKDRMEQEKEKVRNKLEIKKDDREEKETTESGKEKENKVEKVRKSIDARVNALSKLISQGEKLLDKLQIRMDKAKSSGQDVSREEKLMADARGKLADAKVKLAEVESQKGTAMDKKSFKEVQSQMKLIMQDLHIVREDAAKIISTLKRFNSATDGTRSATKSSTPSL